MSLKGEKAVVCGAGYQSTQETHQNSARLKTGLQVNQNQFYGRKSGPTVHNETEVTNN